MLKFRILSLSLIMCLNASLIACSHISKLYNYVSPSSPRYVSEKDISYKNEFNGKIKVVSFNIKHSEKTQEAIDLLKNNPSLANADILLLQEMTPDAIKEISSDLGYNYVYYPAILHPSLQKDFGNAILSKWPTEDDYKVILPPIMTNSRQRIAVSATVDILGTKIQVFSLHMGIFIKPDERKQLVQRIVGPIDPSIDYCIVGGDFNSFTKKDRAQITDSFAKFDFVRASIDTGWTYKQWFFFNRKAPLDHIFTKGLKVIDSGKVDDRSASDHVPIWVDLELWQPGTPFHAALSQESHSTIQN